MESFPIAKIPNLPYCVTQAVKLQIVRLGIPLKALKRRFNLKLSSKQLDDLIRAWPDENGVSSDPETYAAWIRAQREHAGKFIGMALGKKRLESLTEEQSKQIYDVYQKLLEESVISEIGDDEIIAHYEIVTQQKKLH